LAPRRGDSWRKEDRNLPRVAQRMCTCVRRTAKTLLHPERQSEHIILPKFFWHNSVCLGCIC
jgi:hypothetical protein